MKFKYGYLETMEKVRKKIQECEGKHSQQVAYSSLGVRWCRRLK